MRYYRVTNWADLQHYKDRSPPWIKLHRHYLTDYAFSCLQDASKAHLMLIWLYASQASNRIPDDPAYLRKCLNLDSEPDLKYLAEQGFIELEQLASGALAPCNQNAPLEEESRGEERRVQNGKRFVPPTLEEVSAYCDERAKGVNPQKWHDFYCAKGWMVGRNKMKDWKAAVRTWEEKPKANGASQWDGIE